MKLDKYDYLLIALFVVVLGSRLFFSLQAPTFTEDSYYHMRLAENIAETGLPMYNDGLSYGGREYYYPPLFHYVLAGASLIMPMELAAKIIPNLLFSLMVLLVFGIANNVTQSRKYSLLASLFFSFTPVSYILPISSVSPYSLALPLIFTSIYLFTKRRSNLNLLTASIVLAVLTHPSAFLLVVGLILYLLLMKLEGVRIDRKNKEITLFTIFLSFWVLFLLYKKMFLAQGMGVVWQNYPVDLIQTAFVTMDVFQVIYLVGMVPLFLGVIGIFNTVFKESRQDLLLILGFTAGMFILSWLTFINLNIAILFMSVLLSIFAAQGMKARSTYIRRTIFAKIHEYKVFFLVFFFIISQVAPMYGTAMNRINDNPGQEKIDALEWLGNNSEEGSVVLSSLSEGHLVTYFADRKNVMDRNFMTIPDVNQRFRDVKRAFTVRLQSSAMSVMDKYGVDYIYHTREAKDRYGPLYYIDDTCFERVYSDGADIYEVKCRLEDEEA